MLSTGIDHVAVTTPSLGGFVAFFVDHFAAVAERRVAVNETSTMAVIRIGPHTELNVFETSDESQLAAGRLDHFGVRTVNLEAFEEVRRRMVSWGASDGYVSDFGPSFSMFFHAPDGLEGEVLVANPQPDFVHYGPGREAARYKE